MTEATMQTSLGEIPVEEAKEVMASAIELVRGLDESGTVERYMLALHEEDFYHLAVSVIENHEHIVDMAARAYAKKHMPERCVTKEGVEEALELLSADFEYSWIKGKEPECHVRSSYNPNWEPLYHFGVQLLPIEYAVSNGLSPYTEEDIPDYKRQYGEFTVCMFCDSLVERPKMH